MPARRSIWRARRSRAALSRLTGCWISTGTSAIDGAAITIAATTGELEATAGTLTIDGGSISNNRELLATGSGTTLILESLTVTNSGTANVEVDAGATLDLESATISGGIVTVDGLLDSTGTSAIDGAAITIAATTGELEATAGTLTIDGGSISNNRELLATGSGTTLILESLTVTNSGTANVEVDAGATLDLESATISGGIVTVDGLLDFDRHQRDRRRRHHHRRYHRRARGDRRHADHRWRLDQQQPRAVGDRQRHHAHSRELDRHQ